MPTMPSNIKISLTPGALEAAVLKLINSVNEQGQLPALLEVYIEGSEIDQTRFTPEGKAAMIDYLLDRRRPIEGEEKPKAGGYGEPLRVASEFPLSSPS